MLSMTVYTVYTLANRAALGLQNVTEAAHRLYQEYLQWEAAFFSGREEAPDLAVAEDTI